MSLKIAASDEHIMDEEEMERSSAHLLLELIKSNDMYKKNIRSNSKSINPKKKLKSTIHYSSFSRSFHTRRSPVSQARQRSKTFRN